MSDVKKSYALSDVKITFVSLVDRAANKKTFLLTKQADGKAGFQSTGRILKVDGESHFVTGIVYEPMVADAHDNFMTEAEIEKAAHWFMKNGDKVDIQHTFQQEDGLTVVESSVTKADQTIEGVAVRKGTWLMTIEVTNDKVWKAIQDGALTGLSMGGIGVFDDTDVDLEAEADVHKAEGIPEKLNLLERIAKAMGVESAVIKGEMRERYEQTMRFNSFWVAFDTLRELLVKEDPWTGKRQFEDDGDKIQHALQEFSEIITAILTQDKPAELLQLRKAKKAEEAEPVEKAGRKMSRANKDRLNSIAQQLMDFVQEFDDEPEAAQAESESEADADTAQEDTAEMSKDEIQKMIDEAVEKALAKPEAAETEQSETVEVEKAEALTAEAVQGMIDASVAKAAEAEERVTKEDVADMISKAIAEAFKQRGLATSMDDGNDNVEKAETQHYLHGLL